MSAPPSTEYARWPPKPDRVGRELGPWVAVLLVPVDLALYWVLSRRMNGASFVGWTYAGTTQAVVHQIRPMLAELAVILLIIGALGWWTATGMRREEVRIPYAWSLVPVAGFAALTLAACASPKVAEKGLAFLGLAMTITFVAALTEELVFRGIVLHALSRAWGGIAGVLVSSVLFALVHLPSRLDEIADQPAILPVMALSYFGFGVFMCRVRVATGSIWWATTIHTLSNFVTYAFLWGGLGSGLAMGVMKIGLDATGLLLAVSLPIYERFASRRLFIQYARWRIPVDLSVPYHRKLWGQGLTSPKVQARWSALIRGRVVGGTRDPIPAQPSEVSQAGKS